MRAEDAESQEAVTTDQGSHRWRCSRWVTSEAPWLWSPAGVLLFGDHVCASDVGPDSKGLS